MGQVARYASSRYCLHYASMMLKKSASLSCTLGLFGLTGCLHEVHRMVQTDHTIRETGPVPGRAGHQSAAVANGCST